MTQIGNEKRTLQIKDEKTKNQNNQAIDGGLNKELDMDVKVKKGFEGKLDGFSQDESILKQNFVMKVPSSKKNYFIIALLILGIFSINMTFFKLNTSDSITFIDLTTSIDNNLGFLGYVIGISLLILLTAILSYLMIKKWQDSHLNLKKIAFSDVIEINGKPFEVNKVENYSIIDLDDRYLIEAEITGKFL